jgi:pyruvate formate lyase activating enzyme
MICDLKAISPSLHRQLTGVDNHIILENIKWLDQNFSGEFWIRIPLIPGCNGSPEELDRFSNYLKQLNPDRVELLPYHDSGKSKYFALGNEYEGENIPLPTPDQMQEIKRLFTANGVKNIV